jgi:mannitol/fructose-specific phosphotransferase system IIA component (Ntr-type)
MNLANLLQVNRIIPEMAATEHMAAIRELVDHLDALHKLNGHKQEILEALQKREDRTSTGIGCGVAIPHAFSDSIDEVVAVFGRSTQGIEFEAMDNVPVHFVILFLVPKNEYSLHLRTLAAIAKMFNSGEIRNRLAEAKSPEEILAVFENRAAR